MIPAARAMISNIARSLPYDKAEADVNAWLDRPVEVVVIGNPSVVSAFMDERPANLVITVVGWHDKNEVRAWHQTAKSRGPGISVAAISKGPAADVARWYRGRARVGHGNIDALIVAPQITEPFELSTWPVHDILDAWLPLLTLDGWLMVGGYSLKPVQEAVIKHVSSGLLSSGSLMANCWSGRKVQWST